MIITNAESERSNSRGLINKSKEEREETRKMIMITITTATTKGIEEATLIGTAHILREVFAKVLWQLHW